MDLVIRANVEATVARIHDDSPLIRDRVAAGQVDIIGARYELGSGQVEFLN